MARLLDDDAHSFVPNALPQTALTDPEIRLLDHLMKDRGGDRSRRSTRSHYVIKIARLGGTWLESTISLQEYRDLAGLSRLTYIEVGAAIEARIMGN
ncbi:hypothetical protein AAE026_38740 [Bradyrhizobium sp. DN5]|uniref:hypothetical protein n=1 Tax=Bradyrhizobium sp. DN5 TaxID=3056950 RepID=UPI00352618CE